MLLSESQAHQPDPTQSPPGECLAKANLCPHPLGGIMPPLSCMRFACAQHILLTPSSRPQSRDLARSLYGDSPMTAFF